MNNYTDSEIREAFKKSSETISQTCRFEDILDSTLDRHLRLYNEIVSRKGDNQMEDMDKVLSLEEILDLMNGDNTYMYKSTYPRLNKRNDLHVMMLLSELIDGECDIIARCNHDIVYFSAWPEDLAGKVTRNQLFSMLDCGLLYDSGKNCFSLST